MSDGLIVLIGVLALFKGIPMVAFTDKSRKRMISYAKQPDHILKALGALFSMVGLVIIVIGLS